MNTDAGELLPCPFCGGKPEVHYFASGECIKCDGCNVETGLEADGASTAVWNTRQAAPHPSWPDLLLSATVKVSGLEVTIACDDYATMDAVSDILLNHALEDGPPRCHRQKVSD